MSEPVAVHQYTFTFPKSLQAAVHNECGTKLRHKATFFSEPPGIEYQRMEDLAVTVQEYE